MTARLEKLHSALQRSGLDAVAINPGPTLAYLTGLSFHLMERPVVMFFASGKDPALVLPELEMLKVEQLAFPAKAFPYPEDPSKWGAAFDRAAQSLGLDSARKRIGVEPRALRVLEYRYIQAAAPTADFPDATEALGALRLSKEDGTWWDWPNNRWQVGISSKIITPGIPALSAEQRDFLVSRYAPVLPTSLSCMPGDVDCRLKTSLMRMLENLCQSTEAASPVFEKQMPLVYTAGSRPTASRIWRTRRTSPIDPSAADLRSGMPPCPS